MSRASQDLFRRLLGQHLFVTLASGSWFRGAAVALCRLLIPHAVPDSAIFPAQISDLIFVKLLEWPSGHSRRSSALGIHSGPERTDQPDAPHRHRGAFAFRSRGPGVFEWSVVYLDRARSSQPSSRSHG